MTHFALLNLTDGDVIEGESRSDIVDQLIPAHAALPETDEGIAGRFELRIEYLADLAHTAQAGVLASLTARFPGAVATLDEDALTVLHHDRHTETAELTEWEGDLPLFLLATSYEPYTAKSRPVGETVVFLDPTNEATFLDSLVAAGAAELYTKEEA